MKTNIQKCMFLSSLACLVIVSQAFADPLPGRDLLKFSQKPMIKTQILNNNGVLDDFYGHDELSTAYGFEQQPGALIPLYQGRFMADDFADNLSSPVVHVKWWGSYLKDFINPATPVNKFLITFENDVPQDATNPFSHPGDKRFNQVVFRDTDNDLSPGGEFSEKLIRGPDPLLQESLYEYNAELHLNKPFPEQKDTVYWLKIVAMVDVPATLGVFDPYNPQNSPVPVTQWGWHNRDYSQQNTLASPNVAGPPFPPGEAIIGQVGPAIQPTPVWHFQDDAVTGDVRIQTAGPGGLVMPDVFQPFQNMQPTHYLDNIDGPGSSVPGAVGIGQFSKDLAFELYTTVPEPATCALLACSLMALSFRRR
jgi:hypothetical protein